MTELGSVGITNKAINKEQKAAGIRLKKWLLPLRECIWLTNVTTAGPSSNTKLIIILVGLMCDKVLE
jgi:hypothetical protein